MNLTLAMETALQAKNVSGQRRREAQNARDSATNAHSDAMQANREANNTLNIATEFKVSLLSLQKRIFYRPRAFSALK